MRVGILTTDTLHHAFFTKALHARYPLMHVFLERKAASAPFPTHHAFEDQRDSHERECWFEGKSASVADFAPSSSFQSLNDADAISAIAAFRPDVTIVFGTGKLSADAIKAAGPVSMNLHGGDPEQYRGLDSHLWAIYHRDFAALVTCLHLLTERLDDGNIVLAERIALKPQMPLHQLRQINTELCVSLAVTGIEMISRNTQVSAQPQRSRGRYYSFMPTSLKDICVRRFASYTATLEPPHL